MVLEQAVQPRRIQYVFHYDELTWMPDVISRPFNELKIPYLFRSNFVRWLDQFTEGTVYIWPGVISPDPNQLNWGRLVSPNNELVYVIFENDSDQTRFSLEFIGSGDQFNAITHRDGIEAYYKRKH